MYPYWLLFSAAALGALQYQPDSQRRLRGGLLLGLFGVVMALMIGLRYEVGGDWQHYIDAYNFTVNTGEGTQDPAYDLISLLGSAAGVGIWFVNLICAIIFTVGLVAFSRRQPNPWLCILIAIPYLVIVVAMGYTRQAVAIGLILLGLANVETRLARFVVCALLAAAFHKSAIVVLPFFALTRTKNRYLTIVVLLITMLAVYYAFVQVAADRLITNYVEEQYSSQGAGIRVAMNIPPAVALFYFRRRLGLSPVEYTLWRNFAIGAVLAAAALLVTSSSTAVDRLSLYLIPLQIFVLGRLPTFIGQTKRGSLIMTLAIVVYYASIQFVWLNYAANANFWVPYRFYPTAEV